MAAWRRVCAGRCETIDLDKLPDAAARVVLAALAAARASPGRAPPTKPAMR